MCVHDLWTSHFACAQLRCRIDFNLLRIHFNSIGLWSPCSIHSATCNNANQFSNLFASLWSKPNNEQILRICTMQNSPVFYLQHAYTHISSQKLDRYAPKIYTQKQKQTHIDLNLINNNFFLCWWNCPRLVYFTQCINILYTMYIVYAIVMLYQMYTHIRHWKFAYCCCITIELNKWFWFKQLSCLKFFCCSRGKFFDLCQLERKITDFKVGTWKRTRKNNFA